MAVLPSRPGFDLVLTTDAMVAGVHFLIDEPLDLVARKLLRANLSDLAAKAAEPHGYLLTAAWPPGVDFGARALFAAGLAQDQAAFGVRLLGGDTVSTDGPLTVSMTMLGWTPAGRLVRRAGARPGDLVVVSGTIGDAGLGLQALTGGLPSLGQAPTGRACGASPPAHPTARPCVGALRRHATASADVSDGLLADAGHIGEASGRGVTIRLDRLPLSEAAAAWLTLQIDAATARLALATAGDDYEVVCTVPPTDLDAFAASAERDGTAVTVVGEVGAVAGVTATFEEKPIPVERRGWDPCLTRVGPSGRRPIRALAAPGLRRRAASAGPADP